MSVKKLLYAAALLLLAQAVMAQEDGGTAETLRTAELPRVFRGFSLGMGLDELKTALAADTDFVFRGDRDVSFLPNTSQNLVDSAGLGAIKRAFFQLKDGAVFVMTFEMNTEKIDHYSVFTAFSAKYGGPLALDPRQSEWEDGQTRVFIERPLTVKYIDKNVFDGIVAESRVGESSAVILRQEFLEDF
ncbi:MAG: hypothetical protein LBJ86_03900 [Spirochaetaceae bacterium]|jgi:hypothetical protein|nr:hypothetical protein [Spirochaetaceae bacterium]